MGIINKNGSLYMATGIDNSGLYLGLNQAEGRIDQFGTHISAVGDKIAKLTGIGFGVAGLKAFGDEVISVTAEMQLLETSFSVLLGNEAKSNAMIAEIKQYAIQSPLSLSGVSKAAQLLLGFNVEAEKVMPTIKQLGDISMGSTDRFQSLALAFAQMSAAGKLMGQDLLQMINAGFNPLQEISKNTGKTLIQLRKEMEGGAISSEMVAKAFESATSEGGKFYGMTQKQAEGIKGLQAQLEGGLTEAYSNIGKSQNDLIVGGYKMAISLVKNYEDVGVALTALIATYGLYKAAIIMSVGIDKTVTVMRYQAEIAELLKLLPLKEQEANADLKTAVASGKITQIKADQLIAIRAEIQSKLELLRANQATAVSELQTATVAHKAALQRSLASKQLVLQRQQELVLAASSGNAAQYEAAKKALLQAQDERSYNTRMRKLSADSLAINQSRVRSAGIAVETMQTNINTATQTANTASTNALAAAKTRLVAISKNLWAALAPSPYVLAAAAAVALGYGIYKLATATSTQEQAQESLNKVMEQASKKKDELSGKTSDLVGTVNSETKTIFDQISAYQKLQGLYPSLLKNMDIQIFKALGATEQQKLLNAAINEFDFTNQESKLIELNALYDKFVSAQRSNTGGFEIGSVADEISKALDFSFWDKYSKNANETFEVLKQTIAGLEKEKKQRQENLKEAELQAKPEVERNKLLQDQLQVLKEQEASILESILKTGEYKRNIDGTISPVSDIEKKFNNINELLDNWNKNPFAIKNAFANADPVLNELLNKMRLLNEEKQKLTGQLASMVVPIVNKSTLEKQVKDFKELTESLAPDLLKKLQSGKSITPSLINTSPEEFNRLKELEDKYKSLGDAAKAAKSDLKVYEDPDKAEKKAESAANKAETAAEKARKASQKDLDERLKYYNEREKADQESYTRQLENQQKQLDLEQDGFDKSQKQLSLNFDKELLAINKYAQELLEKQQKAERDKWDIENPNGSSTPFSPTTKTIEDLYKINPNAEKEITDSFVIARKAYDKGIADLLKNLTDKYQDYAKQRLEIEKEFNKDIDFLNAQRLNAQTDAEKEVIARSLAKATSDKGKALMSFDFARLKESPEYVRAFEDLKNTSTETLNSLLSQLDEAKQTAATVLSPDQLREYTSTIQSIMDELVERNPYKILIESKKELAQAGRELADAQRQLKQIQEGGKITKMVNENGKLIATYITEEEAILKVNEARDKYNRKNNDVIKSQKKILDQVNELNNALTDLGGNIGGTAGDIISLMGDIGTFATTSMEGISKVAQTGAHAISAIEKASVILAIISAAIMLMKELDSLLPDAHDQYDKYASKIQQINDLEQAVKDYEVAVLKAKQAEEAWFAQDSLQNLKQAKELQQEIVKSKDEINKQAQATYQNESGGGWATSWAKTALQVSKIGQLDKLLGTGLLDGNYEKGTSAAIENLKIETRKKSSGLFGSGIGGKSQKTEDLRTWVKNNLGFDLFDADGWINEEAYEVVMSKYGDKLVGQTKATLEAMAEYKKQYDEYIEQLHEYVSSMYEPLVDNMVDSLWDWLDSGKDALDSFKDYASATFRDIVTDMLKTIVLNDVVGDYKDTVAKLYEDYSAGKITEQELMDGITKETKDLQNRYETALPGLQMFLDGVNKSLESVTGIDIKDQQDKTSQQASKGGYETMSQDTGTAIEGLQRSTQMSVLNIEGYILTLIGIHTDSNSILRSFSANFQELRNIGLDIMYNIQDIKKNTNELYEINSEIKGMSRKLDSL